MYSELIYMISCLFGTLFPPLSGRCGRSDAQLTSTTTRLPWSRRYPSHLHLILHRRYPQAGTLLLLQGYSIASHPLLHAVRRGINRPNVETPAHPAQAPLPAAPVASTTTISAEAQLRDFQMEGIAFVPASLQRRRGRIGGAGAGSGTGNVNLAPVLDGESPYI